MNSAKIGQLLAMDIVQMATISIAKTFAFPTMSTEITEPGSAMESVKAGQSHAMDIAPKATFLTAKILVKKKKQRNLTCAANNATNLRDPAMPVANFQAAGTTRSALVKMFVLPRIIRGCARLSTDQTYTHLIFLTKDQLLWILIINYKTSKAQNSLQRIFSIG